MEGGAEAMAKHSESSNSNLLLTSVACDASRMAGDDTWGRQNDRLTAKDKMRYRRDGVTSEM